MASAEFVRVLSFFKALSDESRLKIVGALAANDRSVEELATLLDLRAPTVSHHLAKLKEIGLVDMRSEGTTHIYRINMSEMRTLAKRVLALDTIETLGEDLVEDAWDRKILGDFFEGQRLKEIPASRKKREVILRWLADRFQFDKRYPEKEVNTIIAKHHPDFATLRRELIGARLLARESGVYWRP
ncbi:MAG: metalloregulator ArsR/SmtB family transcription factor [Candidatus Obscuribacterales bacterium]|nr:metalloregulator ArsR/SmtB family transcription factor [Candidatus Obscuribacterales bacterium]